jgi:carbamoyl-phosphate synthase large subunit
VDRVKRDAEGVVMNVLLTCAGRRSYEIGAFRQAVGDQGRVLACDADPNAPALQMADGAFVVPRIDADDYVDALLELCAQHEVGLVIPAFEPELPILAARRAEFEAIGTNVLVSSPEVIATCYDKVATAAFLAARGIRSPRTYLSLEGATTALHAGEFAFPVMVKPRFGVSSIGNHMADDEEELAFYVRQCRKQIAETFLATSSATDPATAVLIQEVIDGVEYGLDIVNDLDGRYACTFVKRKLRMRAGQTDRASTVDDPALQALGAQIGQGLGHLGILDCDTFVDREGICVIDLNPRFGGGYPFSHVAGANLPAALIAWASGAAVDPAWLRVTPGVTVARYDQFVVAAQAPHDEET